MAENQEPVESSKITPNDRTWAALSWLPITPLWPVLAIVALLMENTKDQPFVRYNAIVSIVTGVVLIPLTIVTVGCAALLSLVCLVCQGQEVKIPVVSDWVRKQGWA